MSTIFWDFDGTLTYSNSLWPSCAYASLNDVFGGHGISYEKLKAVVLAKGFTWHNPDYDYSHLKNEAWWSFIQNKIVNDYETLGIPKDIAVNAASRVRKHILERNYYILYSDAIYTLESLKQRGHHNIILSNNFPELEQVIESLNIYHFFDGFIVSAKEGYDKPRKELFDIAKIKFSNDNKMYMVGDSLEADIIGGANAGLTTIYVHRGKSDVADYCCDNLSDILSIIQ